MALLATSVEKSLEPQLRLNVLSAVTSLGERESFLANGHLHRSLGHRPRLAIPTIRLAEGHIQPNPKRIAHRTARHTD